MAEKNSATKLNQIVAIEKGVKTRTYGAITDLHKTSQNAALYYGFSKTYTPKFAEGETFPREEQKVQLRAAEVLEQAATLFSEIIDITATKDTGNLSATADIKIGDRVLDTNVPVPQLLFLEKQLTDLSTFIDKLPVLDEAQDWTKESSTGLFKTQPTEKYKTNKEQRPIVLYEATEKHPAQTQLVTQDVVVGTWSQVNSSGAITRDHKRMLTARVQSVLDAVKFAREQANGIEVQMKRTGTDLMAYIFEPLINNQ